MVPNTPGWDRLMRKRLDQVSQIEDLNDRWQGYISAITQAVVAPNFTENGWGLTRAPKEIVDLLWKSLHDNMANAIVEHDPTLAIEGAKVKQNYERPLFIEQSELNAMVLENLKPMHEKWAGIPLKGQIAYGLRVYRNQSVLHMHGKLRENNWRVLVAQSSLYSDFCLQLT